MTGDYWRVGSNGNVAPIGAIAGSNTGLFYGTQGIVVTASEIYVAEEYTDAILGFPLNSSGNVAPNVIIAGSQTNIHSPIGLALDSHDNLYVANCGGCDGTQSSPYAVEEFAAGSTGNVAPLRAIVGPDTQIHYPAGLAVAANGDLYVGDAEQPNEMNPGKIVVFSSTANGDAAPERSIAGSNTELYDSAGIAVTPQSLFVESYPDGPGAPVILRFNLQANGNVAPLASIEGPNTGLNPYLEGLASGLQGSSIYGVDPGTLLGGSPRPAILQFASNGSGNALPLTSITGPNTRLFIPLFGYVRQCRVRPTVRNLRATLGARDMASVDCARAIGDAGRISAAVARRPGVKALLYFDAPGSYTPPDGTGCDFSFSSVGPQFLPSGLAGWISLGNDPYFGATITTP